MKHLIELKSVEKYYTGSSGKLHVLHNITLYIEKHTKSNIFNKRKILKNNIVI